MNELKVFNKSANTSVSSLQNEIKEYVYEIIKGEIPRISFEGYRSFRDNGNRKESETEYFSTRKQLTALGTYLTWSHTDTKVVRYFNELLWSIANEFTWCLAAHLPYEETLYVKTGKKQIDLFAAETAATLAELLVIHDHLIDSYIKAYIIKEIEERVIAPFMEREWHWEKSKGNWSAVCSGCIGMAALYMDLKNKELILNRVDKALEHYIKGFGGDGASEEGIGYWVYGFGYFIYYLALREELDSTYHLSEEMLEQIKKVGEFPRWAQIAQGKYLPFSDVPQTVEVPSGLLSYIKKRFQVMPPKIESVTSFHFDHCYRYAHISRNLMWTDLSIFDKEIQDGTCYFQEKKWLIERKKPFYVGVKGGSNSEEHNHNDVGSFILGIEGELILTDLGAGQYTADYFNENRYKQIHTRSYWHNIPMIQKKEQSPTKNSCEITKISIGEQKKSITMRLDYLYEIESLKEYKRTFELDLESGIIKIEDEFKGFEKLEIDEGFVSYIEPHFLDDHMIVWKGIIGELLMKFDPTLLTASFKKETIINHYGISQTIYRLGLKNKQKVSEIKIQFEFILSEKGM